MEFHMSETTMLDFVLAMDEGERPVIGVNEIPL